MGAGPATVNVYFKKNVVRYNFDTQGGNALASKEEVTDEHATATT